MVSFVMWSMRPVPPQLRGSGTKNYVAKFTSSSTLGNSQISKVGRLERAAIRRYKSEAI